MQEPPANGEEQFPACPYCGSALVAGEAHDCDEVGDANTLSVGVLGKDGLPARNFAAESNPKPTPTQIHNPPEAPARSTSSDEIHGLIIDGRYEVLEKASQGGMGTVYKARHATLRHLLAVKILRKPKDEVSRRRFLQEAQLLSQIKHPNIVQVIDFGELTDGKSYLAMEYLSGPTLTAAVREGHMTPQRACRIGAQIARGMHHVHELGIVHRDLKPDNVLLVNQDGNADFVKIIDFGIAKDVKAMPGWQLSGAMRVSSASLAMASQPEPAPETPEDFGNEDTPEQSLTLAGQLVGTPLYMAPEQIRHGVHDAKGDQYALGCMLYFMLTGQPVFSGKRPDDIMSAHVKQAVVRPRERKPGLVVSEKLEAIILKALSKDPAARFESMRALEEALETCIADMTPAPLTRGQFFRKQLRRWLPVWGPALAGLLFLLVYVLQSRRGKDEVLSPAELRAVRARAIAVLLQQTSSPDLRLKLPALRALGQSREGAQKDLLEKFLSDADPKIVAQAAESLGLLGEPSAAAALLSKIGQAPDAATKVALALALERLGETKGTQLLYDGLAGKDNELRMLSALLLCERGNRSAVELLLSVLEKGQVGGPIELSVLGCLARAGNEASYKTLLVRLQQSEPREAQLKAAQQLILLGDNRAQTLLEKLANEPGRDQLLAARYLASPEHQNTAQVFRSLILDSDASASAIILAVEGLGLSGQTFDVRILDQLLGTTSDEALKLAAAEAIVRLVATDVRLMSERSLLWARDALASGSSTIREAGVATLGDRPEQEASTLIVSMLKDPAAQVRRAAVRALVRRDAEGALDTLKDQLSDGDSLVRIEALQALVRTASRLVDRGQKSSVEKITEWLKETVRKGSASEQAVARSGLLMLGDASQKATLRDLLSSGTDEIRKLLAEQQGLDSDLLRLLLADRKEDIRFLAARRLAERGDTESKAVLREMAKKGGSEALTAAVLLRRLGENTDGISTTPSQRMLSSVEQRMQLIESVQNLDANLAVPVLMQATRDPEPLVRRLVVEVAADLPAQKGQSPPGLPIIRMLAKDGDAGVRARVWSLLWRLELGGQEMEEAVKRPIPAATELRTPAAPKTPQDVAPVGLTEEPAGKRGKLLVDAKSGTLLQIDDRPWQNASTGHITLPAGKHTLRALSGERPLEIIATQTLTVKLPQSEAEEQVEAGIELLGKGDYRRAQKLFDRAHGRCKHDKALATPCDLLEFEGTFHLAAALESGHHLTEAMVQYQKLLKISGRSKTRGDKRGEIQTAVQRLSTQLGEIVISEAKKGKCQQSSLWVLPGTHIVSVGGKSQQVQVSAQQKLVVGSCS